MSEEVAGALDTVKPDSVLTGTGVRRLTPRECERLQGWPDDYTARRQSLRLDGNRWVNTGGGGETIAQKDGPRYSQCGNGVTANVTEWIGNRFLQFTENLK